LLEGPPFPKKHTQENCVTMTTKKRAGGALVCAFALAVVAVVAVAAPGALAEGEEARCAALPSDPCECEGPCEDLPLVGSAKVCYVKNPETCPEARSAMTRSEDEEGFKRGSFILCPPPVNCVGSWQPYSACLPSNATETGGSPFQQCREYLVTQAGKNGGAECPFANCEEDCIPCTLEPVYEEREVCEAYSTASPGSVTFYVSQEGYVANVTEEECEAFLLTEGSKRARESLRSADDVEYVGGCEVVRDEAYACSGCEMAEGASSSSEAEAEAASGGTCLFTGVRAGNVRCKFNIKNVMEHSCTMKKVCVKHC